MRTFVLRRIIDEGGASGLGEVLDGVIFPDGATVVKWRKSRSFGHGISNLAIFSSFEDFRAVHVDSHAEGANEVRFSQEGDDPN
jgi:hypothetical protein